MARKKKDSLSAFSAALDDFGFNNAMGQEGVTDMNNIVNDDIDNPIDNNTTSNLDDTEDHSDEDRFEDNTPIPDNILNNEPPVQEPDN